MKRTLLALLTFAVASGCMQARPGAVHTSAQPSPLVTIEAGLFEMVGGPYLASYLVDRGTHTCWFWVYGSATAMDCCNLRLVPSAASIITWETDATCQATATTPLPPATPPAPPPPPSATTP